jgi:glycosyltransferase involved in cell wall biosynthesis
MDSPSTASGSRSGAVLQVVLALNPGGTERLVVETVRRLRGRQRMVVCCLDQPGAWGEELAQEGVEVVALAREAGFRPSLGAAIANVADRTGANVLHCHQYTPFIYGCIARALRPRLRVLFTEHGRLGDGPPSRKRRIANRLFSRVPSRVCAVSEDLRRHMASEGFRSSQIDVVSNGIDPGVLPDERARREARQLLGLDEAAFVIGTVGRLDPVKDLPTLIEAFRQVRHVRANAHLVIVGDGPERDALQRTAAGVEGIKFTGHRGDVRRCLAAFDVYASSSVFEGVSLTILEAMASGCPVVATRVGGTPEVVVDGRTGVLVAARDAGGLARALEQVSTDSRAARAMGQAGRTRLCERFTLDRMITHYAQVYSELEAV